MKINSAVILCAGRGTRFLPYTKAVPKEMLPVVDVPALELLVREVCESGITRILMVISPSKQAVVRYFDRETCLRLGADISFAYQKQVTGTASAVQLAKKFVKGQPFAVLNGDDVTNSPHGKSVTAQLVDAFDLCGSTIVGVQTVPRAEISRYASCVTDKNGDFVTKKCNRMQKIVQIVEKPPVKSAPSLLAPLGRYVLTPDVFEAVKRVPTHQNGEKFLPDALNLLMKTQPVYSYDFVGKRYDFGNKLGYITGMTELALQSQLGNEYARFLKETVKKL